MAGLFGLLVFFFRLRSDEIGRAGSGQVIVSQRDGMRAAVSYNNYFRRPAVIAQHIAGDADKSGSNPVDAG